jgi:hypothetical protein
VVIHIVLGSLFALSCFGGGGFPPEGSAQLRPSFRFGCAAANCLTFTEGECLLTR